MFVDEVGSPYFALLSSCICYVAIVGLYAAFQPAAQAFPQRSFIVAGFAQAVSSLLLVYSSPGISTPPPLFRSHL